MKRNFVVGVFGGVIGSALVLMLLSTVGIVGAAPYTADRVNGAEVRSDATRLNAISAATPLTSAFTYQGQLKNGGNAVNGSCQMAFRLYDDPAAGNLIGSPITPTVPVTNGLFNVGLNFGSNAFNGNGRWLDIKVNCGSGFIALTPRQPLTAAPYAFALPGLYTQPNPTSPNVIGGYSGNVVSSTVVGGVIGGGGFSGYENRVQADYATVSGGRHNTASDYAATVGGGYNNTASNYAATIGGGYNNTASNAAATVGGGTGNTASTYAATVGGGYNNTASNTYATVGGGYNNTASGYRATVGGGYNNTAGFGATVGGGYTNTASSSFATVGGGVSNTVSAYAATVGGGYSNTASGYEATVGGGEYNTASGYNTAVGGGYGNTASGYDATVPGGFLNTALGDFSFAAGYRAKANHAGAFVWGDSTAADIASTAPNQFLVRASGGARFYGGNNWDLNATEGDWRVGDDTYRLKIGVAMDGGGAGDVYIGAQGGTNRILFWTPGGMIIYSNDARTAGVQLAPGGGTWSDLSDRNVKANFTAVDGRDVLARLATIPIQTWNYRSQDAAIRHIGPMAQDFYAAFNIGEDDKHITTIDAEGVALAAIQGLNQSLQEKNAQIDALQKQYADMQARLTNLEQNAPPASFNLFNLLSVIAFAGFMLNWIQQRRSKRGHA